jgi:hypothetical protein
MVSIRHGVSCALAEYHAALTLDYITDVYDVDINGAQCDAFVISLNEAADDWRPSIGSDRRLLEV